MSITITAPAKPTANQPTVDHENVSATLTVAVPAERVFAVLADPATHSAIDGTGWVQEAVDWAPLTEAGQIFRMDMYHAGHPNGDYQVVNKVVVLDPPRAIRERDIQFPPFGPEHLTNSLHHLAELAAPTTGGQTSGGRP